MFLGNTMWRDLLLFDPTPSLLPPPASISPEEAVVGYMVDGKTALYSHSALVNGAALFGSAVGLTTADRICLASPLHTSQGLQAGKCSLHPPPLSPNPRRYATQR
jgi:hypothetical protein